MVRGGGGIWTSADSGATWTHRTAAGSRHWTSIASSSDGTKLAAVVRGGGGIWTSADSGATWTHRTAAGNRDWYSIASSSDGTKLAAVERVRWTTTGIYTSDDSGATWTPRSIYGGGNWVSIASSSDGTKLAAVMEVYVWGSDWGSANYRYQYYGVLCTSDDSGATWTHRMAAGIRRKWYSIASSSDGTKLAAVVFGGSIYTSDDSGATWRNSSR